MEKIQSAPSALKQSLKGEIRSTAEEGFLSELHQIHDYTAVDRKVVKSFLNDVYDTAIISDELSTPIRQFEICKPIENPQLEKALREVELDEVRFFIKKTFRHVCEEIEWEENAKEIGEVELDHFSEHSFTPSPDHEKSMSVKKVSEIFHEEESVGEMEEIKMMPTKTPPPVSRNHKPSFETAQEEEKKFESP